MTLTYQLWMQQPLIWAERCRGRSLVWTPEAEWFINDPLGRNPHAHDEASEIVFLAQGRMVIQVGRDKQVYQAGDFILMPPGKYHDYWHQGQDPVCMFVLVGPNHKERRWRTKDFPPQAFEGTAPCVNVYHSDAPLPSDPHLASTKVTLQPQEFDPTTQLALQDRVIYVLEGTASLQVGLLAGALSAHQYQYIPATTVHRISNQGLLPLTYISIIVTDPATALSTKAHDSAD